MFSSHPPFQNILDFSFNEAFSDLCLNLLKKWLTAIHAIAVKHLFIKGLSTIQQQQAFFLLETHCESLTAINAIAGQG